MVSLGIDIGGTGCKCAAFTEDGRQVSIAYAEYTLPAGGGSIPPRALADAVFDVIRRCAAALPEPREARVLTVSSFGESFVPLDDAGEPLSDIRMYFAQEDNRAFRGMVDAAGADIFMDIARILPDPSYSLAGLMYTRDHTERPVHKYLFIAGYILYLLTGEAVTDVSLACRSLLFDVKAGRWSQRLMELSGIREETLPAVVPSGTAVGHLLPEAAATLGLSPETLAVIGTHDQIVNALGAGVEAPGDAVDTSGTCECITPLFSAIPESRDFLRGNFACVPYLKDAGYVTYAYNISAGSVVRWYRDTFGGALAEEARVSGASVYDIMNRTCPPDPGDLLVLPYLQGMGGTPNVDADMTGLVSGLTTRTRLPDLYRAILEGITLEMRLNQEALRENGITFSRLLACGGGARSLPWLGIKADILGCPIIPVLTEETGALGSAILGFSAVSGEDPFSLARAFARRGDPVLPRPEFAQAYAERFARFKELRAFSMSFASKKGASI